MNTDHKIPFRPAYPWPLLALIVTTVFAIAVSLYYLNTGRFIVFQNLFYFPIIIACIYYLKKGFVFSVLLAFFYLFLILAYTSNSTIIHQAFIRVAIFIMIAGVVSSLSLRRSKSEEARRKNESKYRQIFESIEDVYYQTNSEGIIEIVSPSVFKTAGWMPDELIGKSGREIYAIPSDRERFMSALFEHHHIRDFELMLKDKQGELRHSSVSARLLFDSQGAFRGLAGTIRDISERKMTESALQASELRYRRLFESAKDGILILDAETGRIADINPYLMELLGYSYDELHGKHLWEIGLFKDNATSKDAFKTLQDNQYIRYEDLPLETRDGRVIAVEFVSNVFLVDHIKVIHCNIRDISTRRKAEDALRRSEENFRRSLDESPLGVRIVTAEGETIYANRVLLDIYGYEDLEELRSNPVRKRYTPESYAGFQIRREARRIGLGETSSYEISIIRKSGEIRHLQVHRKYVPWNGKQQFQVIYIDVTEHKKWESSLMKSDFIINSSSEFMTLVNTNYIYEGVNKAYCKALGKSREEIIGRSVIDIWGENRFQNIIKAKIDRCFGGVPVTDESWIVFPGAERRYFSINYYPFSTTGEKISHVAIISHDMTDKKLVEVSLKQANERLILAQNAASAGVWDWNIVTGHMDWSDNLYDLFGLNHQNTEASFETWMNVLHVDDRETAVLRIDRAMQQRGTLSSDYRVVLPDGGIRWINAAGKGEYDEAGRPLRMVGICMDISERRNSEASLQESEARFKELFEGVSSGIAVYRAVDDGNDFILVDLNKSGERIDNVSRDVVIGRRVTEVFPAVKSFGLLDVFCRVWKTGIAEHFFITDYQDDRIASWRDNFVYRLDSGEIVAVYDDVTGHKQAEEELLRAEKKYRNIIENAKEGIFQTTPEGRFLMANRALSQMLGYASPEELIATITDINTQIYVNPEERRWLLKALEKKGYVKGYETQFLRKDGSRIWVLISMHKVTDRSGRILHIEGINQDITEHKLMERSLIESEHKYRNLVDHALVGVYQVRMDGRIIFANRAFAEIFGYSSSEEIMKVNAAELYCDPEERRLFVRKMKKQGMIRNHEITSLTKGGELRYNIVSAVLDHDIIIGMVMDITGQKKEEHTLRKHGEKLRSLSAKLSEAEEGERKRIAMELHDQTGQNLTALGINMNIIQSINAGNTDDRIRQRIEDSMTLIEKTAQFTRDLMADLRPPVMDDYGLMASIRWYSEEFTRRTGIEVFLTGDDFTPRPAAQIEVTLFRIVQECLTNVSKHAQAKQVEITGEITTSHLKISVMDNGIGLDPKKVYRTDNRHHWGIEAMTERAESIGGHISIKSDPGQGTKVFVAVPI